MGSLPEDGIVHTLKHARDKGLDIALRLPYRHAVTNQPVYVQLWQSDDGTGDPYEMVELTPGQLDELTDWWTKQKEQHHDS